LGQYFGAKNNKAVFWIWNFLAPKYWKKSARKMLMKFTPGDLNKLHLVLVVWFKA